MKALGAFKGLTAVSHSIVAEQKAMKITEERVKRVRMGHVVAGGGRSRRRRKPRRNPERPSEAFKGILEAF